MIYEKKPNKFNPKFDVVGCFVEYNWKFLLLHRQNNKPQANTWWIPGGKVDIWESIENTMIRELKEETWLELPLSKLSYFNKVYIKSEEYDFVYHMFSLKLNTNIDIILNLNEHKDFNWISPKNSLNLPLIHDLDNCIKLFYIIIINIKK